MKWTHKPPDKPGWYWYRKYPTWPVRMVEVVEYGPTSINPEGLLQDGWAPRFSANEGRSTWAGPIYPPSPEETDNGNDTNKEVPLQD